jgi:hypothetical protein
MPDKDEYLFYQPLVILSVASVSFAKRSVHGVEEPLRLAIHSPSEAPKRELDPKTLAARLKPGPSPSSCHIFRTPVYLIDSLTEAQS